MSDNLTEGNNNEDVVSATAGGETEGINNFHEGVIIDSNDQGTKDESNDSFASNSNAEKEINTSGAATETDSPGENDNSASNSNAEKEINTSGAATETDSPGENDNSASNSNAEKEINTSGTSTEAEDKPTIKPTEGDSIAKPTNSSTETEGKPTVNPTEGTSTEKPIEGDSTAKPTESINIDDILPDGWSDFV